MVVYADTVILRSRIVLPGRKLSIVARALLLGPVAVSVTLADSHLKRAPSKRPAAAMASSSATRSSIAASSSKTSTEAL